MRSFPNGLQPSQAKEALLQWTQRPPPPFPLDIAVKPFSLYRRPQKWSSRRVVLSKNSIIIHRDLKIPLGMIWSRSWVVFWKRWSSGAVLLDVFQKFRKNMTLDFGLQTLFSSFLTSKMSHHLEVETRSHFLSDVLGIIDICDYISSLFGWLVLDQKNCLSREKFPWLSWYDLVPTKKTHPQATPSHQFNC